MWGGIRVCCFILETLTYILQDKKYKVLKFCYLRHLHTLRLGLHIFYISLLQLFLDDYGQTITSMQTYATEMYQDRKFEYYVLLGRNVMSLVSMLEILEEHAAYSFRVQNRRVSYTDINVWRHFPPPDLWYKTGRSAGRYQGLRWTCCLHRLIDLLTRKRRQFFLWNVGMCSINYTASCPRTP